MLVGSPVECHYSDLGASQAFPKQPDREGTPTVLTIYFSAPFCHLHSKSGQERSRLVMDVYLCWLNQHSFQALPSISSARCTVFLHTHTQQLQN